MHKINMQCYKIYVKDALYATIYNKTVEDQI